MLLGCLFAGLLPQARAGVSPPASGAAPAVIRVVGDNNYPPFLFVGADGRLQGYEADRWQLFQAHTGIRVELAPTGWDAAKQAVQSGRADVIDLIYRTSEREALYDFSAPYATLPLGIYVDDGVHGVHDVASLRGYPIGVGRGSVCARQLASLGFADVRTYDNFEHTVQAAVRGDVHAFCMNEESAWHALQKEGALGRFGRAFVLNTGQFHWAVRKGNTAMLRTVQRGMAQITPAELAALKARWLDQPFDAAPYERAALLALAVVLLVVALMALWVWMLRRSVAARTRELRAEERKLRALFDASPDALWVKDRDGILRECNDRVPDLYGVPRERLLGRSGDDLLPPVLAARVRAMDEEVMRLGQHRAYLQPAVGGAAPRQYEVVKVPFNDGGGEVRGVLSVARDITDRLRSEAELRLAAAAFEAQEALMVMGRDRTIQRVNQAFVRLTGHAAAEAVGQSVELLRSRQHDEAFYRQVWEQVEHDGLWQGERWICVEQGRSLVVRMTISAVHDTAGEVSQYVCSMIDLTGEREAHASVDHLTFFDALTDLPNRYFLRGRLQQVLDDGDARGGVLLLVGLDHFKRVNDLHGHAVGDRVLVQVAQRLRQMQESGWVPSRFSGDAFVLLLPIHGEDAAARPQRARDGAQQACALLREPFPLGDGPPVALTASVGWTELVPGEGSPEAVLKEAELAMYGAKAAGRDQVRWFEPAMQAALERHEALAQDLRRAIAEDALELHYQAQVDRRGRHVGAEALLRWTRADGEQVSPAEFIPIAEESGLILPLGDWVLRRACAQLTAWAGQGRLGGLSLAVNVSARQFAQPGFVDGVREALAATGATPERLKLEITESVVMGDLEEAAFKLSRLRELGIRISLDDFGTGYSSLSYLSCLPLDQLKIDQSFVRHLTEDATDAMVAQTVIAMGRGLGLEVIAEGVETAGQHAFLLAQGCDAFQGYLFARPLSLAAFEALPGEHFTRA
jgi:diguanylate cyclase (GGDEF)-like protein/PAS domain S-box-containing protein